MVKSATILFMTVVYGFVECSSYIASFWILNATLGMGTSLPKVHEYYICEFIMIST